jgi:hypothetical protein
MILGDSLLGGRRHFDKYPRFAVNGYSQVKLAHMFILEGDSLFYQGQDRRKLESKLKPKPPDMMAQPEGISTRR